MGEGAKRAESYFRRRPTGQWSLPISFGMMKLSLTDVIRGLETRK
jgi:hypothetical protein